MTISQKLQSKYIPTDITKCIDTGIETASYDYYTGIKLMKELNRKNTGYSTTSTYMVCCGDVMTTIQQSDYVDIARRSI